MKYALRQRGSRTLQVDGAAERALDAIVACLRSAREASGQTRAALAVGLPVLGSTIYDWELGATTPVMRNLILWSGALGYRLVVVGPDGELRRRAVRQRPGEEWERYERRRLATPLRNHRLALGLDQDALGRLVGVSRDSIQRWEQTTVPPRPIAHIVWAQKLGYGIALQRDPTTGLRQTAS